MADFDLFVIGAGSGGVRGARIAANLGARAGISEEYRYGGTCVIRGCVPKKMFVYASHFSEEFQEAADFGWDVGTPKFNWKTLIANKDKEIERLSQIYVTNLKNAGVEMFKGHTVLKDRNTVVVDGKEITADTILVATGGKPYIPDHPGIEHAITSNETFHLEKLPKSIVIAGAGYIAVEFAGIFNGLGVDTTVIYRKDKVLRGFDEDLRDHLTAEMQAKGIKFIFNNIIDKVEKTKDGVAVTCTNGSVTEADHLMLAIGRRPNTEGLGLEEAGVQLAPNGAIKVDEHSKSSVDNIYAVGDVTDRINLTPVAIKEGHAFALTKYGNTPTSPEHDNVPSAVFSQPPIGTVGMTEDEAWSKYGEVEVYTAEFRDLKYTLGDKQEKTFMKLIVDKKSRIVVGAHIIGSDAPEIVQGYGVAVKNCLTKEQFDKTIGIHPTKGEEFVQMREPRKP